MEGLFCFMLTGFLSYWTQSTRLMNKIISNKVKLNFYF